jgi:hypothetical protein
MPTYLVAVQPDNPIPDNPELLEEIEQYSNHIELSDTTYIIVSPESSATIYKRMRKHVEDNDPVYVFELSGQYSGHGPNQIIDWLNDVLHHPVHA